MVLTWTAKSESKMIRVSISALFCDSDLSAPSKSEVVVNYEGGGETEKTDRSEDQSSGIASG